jgi:site-specific DNA-adenine methylase
MQTLIKWPGGKTKEYPYIEDLIPDFDRYIEPFFGGGAIFFQLQPKKAVIFLIKLYFSFFSFFSTFSSPPNLLGSLR